MKIPEKAPDWLTILSNDLKRVLAIPDEFKSLNDFVSGIDQKKPYRYWDEFKYVTNRPSNIATEVAWSYLKLSRQSKIGKTKLVDENYKHFGYWIPDHVLQNLSFIDKYASGQILVTDSKVHASEEKRYLVNSLMEEAIASSQLEGAATTRKVAKEMLRSGRKPKNNAEQMIFNNFQTIVKIKDFVGRKLDNDLLFEIHRLITVETLDDPDWCGRLRSKDDNPIHVTDKKDGHVLHVPPKPEKIPHMMKILYDYANEKDGEKFTHPVIRATNLHFYLSYIHPFNDGNGRTARALFYWYMLNHGYWMFEFLTISRIFLKAPVAYAQAFLYTEMDDLDLTYFISFHLRVINTAITRLMEYIKRKQEEVMQIAYHLKKYPEMNNRQKDILRHALANADAQYTIKTHKTIHNVTYETARRDLLYLSEKQLLFQVKKGKKFYYMPSEKLHKEIGGV